MGFKSIDIFGYEVNLNFNQNGSTYKTCFGAVLTILFYVITMFAFIIMITQDSHKFGTTIINNETSSSTTLQSAGLNIQIQLLEKQSNGGSMYPIPYDSTAQKYFKVELIQNNLKQQAKNCFKES